MTTRPSVAPADPLDVIVPLARRGGKIAALPAIGGASLTQQTLQVLVHGIRSGAFEGGRVPTEETLAEMLGVSRTTVRRALQSLEQLGLVERRPGRGTRLRRHANPDLLALHGLTPFPTLLRELGHEVTTQVRWNRVEVADPELSLLLGRPVPGMSYQRNIVLLADGQPAISMVERFPADVLAAPLDEDDDLSTGSIMFLSDRRFTEKIDHAIASIEPHVAAPDNGGATAGVKPGEPYFVLNETFYSEEETPLAASRVSVNPGYVSFSVFRRFL